MSSERFTRRGFLARAAVGSAMGAIGLGRAASTAAPVGTEKPLFRFVQWNDTHIDATTPSDYKLANEKAKYLVESLNAATLFPVPDFVIGIGDIINGEGLPSLAPDFALFKKLTAGLKCPYYPVVGNHEVVQQEGNTQYEAAYRQAFGDHRTNYSFRHGGMQFVVLDDSGAPASNRSEVGRRRNRWLGEVLAAAQGLPTILCCHIPLVPLRDEEVLKKSFGFGSYIAHDAELLKLVDAHATSIVAVLSGHLHLTGVVRRNGVYHVVVSGTGSYPCDFASYEVFADRIRMRVHSLPPQLVTPETDIHGRPRFATDYTDAAHATHEAYVKGNPSERALDMVLGRRLAAAGARQA
jgi:predicted MPP superfamily phosphohydrolase